jgi:hypothetical protein
MGLVDGETRGRGQSPRRAWPIDRGRLSLGAALKDYLDAIVAEIRKLEPAGSSNGFAAFVLVREVPRELAGR